MFCPGTLPTFFHCFIDAGHHSINELEGNISSEMVEDLRP